MQEIQNCSEQVQKASAEILQSEMLVSELFIEKEKSQQNSRLLHEQVQALIDERKQTEQFIRQKKIEQNQIEQEINGLKIEQGQFCVMKQNLIDKVQEQLQIDLIQVLRNLYRQLGQLGTGQSRNDGPAGKNRKARKRQYRFDWRSRRA